MIHLDSRLGGKSFKQRLLKVSYPKRMIHLDSRLGGKSFKQRLLKVSYPKRMIHLDSRLGGKSFKQRPSYWSKKNKNRTFDLS
jgi:hypothetical protein